MTNNNEENVLEGIALAELLIYIEDLRIDSPVLKLSDLDKLYTSRLEQLGCKFANRIHSTRLKNRILAHFPDIQAHKIGREVFLAFNEEIASALNILYEKQNCDDEAIILAKAANIIRRDMADITSCFKGSFEKDCQRSSMLGFNDTQRCKYRK